MNIDIQTKIEDLLEQHKDKLRYAGAKNSIVRHVTKLKDNSKPNPRKLLVMEGIWAFGMAERAKLPIINFILCPECIFSLEAYELASKFAEKAEDINIVSKKVFMSFSKENLQMV